MNRPADSLELIACPFCGRGEFVRIVSEGDQHAVVCDARGSLNDKNRGCGAACGYQDTEVAARTAWNRAALTPQPPAAVDKRWPFVESPGEFAQRLELALREFDVLGAVRNVLIEEPPTLATPTPAADRAAFEAWARPKWGHPEDFDPRISAPAKHNNYEVQAAWEAWQHVATPPPAVPDAVRGLDEFPSLPSAAEWLDGTRGLASHEWMAGWDAARNRLQTMRMTEAALSAAPEWLELPPALRRDVPDYGTAPRAAAQEDRICLSVCWMGDGDDPFICAVSGKVTVAILQEIEADLLENPPDNGAGEYTFTATHFPGQYGENGRCELSPGWELDLISFTPMADALAAQQDGQP